MQPLQVNSFTWGVEMEALDPMLVVSERHFEGRQLPQRVARSMQHGFQIVRTHEKFVGCLSPGHVRVLDEQDVTPRLRDSE